MPGTHSLLSPSGSSRWLHCPPSARLCESVAEEDSVYALEGTECHSLCEYKVLKALGRPCTDPVPGMKLYSPEMEGCADEFCVAVLEAYEKAGGEKKAFIGTEISLDISAYIRDCRGTSDCVIISDGTVQVWDYKHGQGVLVEADHNTQLMIYALGVLDLFGDIFDLETVELVIFQPRLSNYSRWAISVSDLLEWAETELKPKAELAFQGAGEACSGPWCKFCKVRGQCRKRAEYNLELAKYDFKDPPLLTAEELGEVLKKAEGLSSWCSDIRDYALKLLLEGGHIDGFKLVEGRSQRRYTDEGSVARTVEEAGYDPYEKKVLGITAMTGLLGGKRKFDSLLGSFVEKPAGKPTMVADTDKRPAMRTDAKNDFDDKEKQ